MPGTYPRKSIACPKWTNRWRENAKNSADQIWVATTSKTSSSVAAMAKAVVPSRERCSIMGRSFGNLEAKDSRCANIQRCCTTTSSASWRMKATGSNKTRYNTLSALILILLAMTVQNYNKKYIPPKRKSTYSVFGVQKTLFPRKIYPNRDNSFSLITESSGLSDRSVININYRLSPKSLLRRAG